MDLVLIEVPVVDEQALGEVVGQLGGPRCAIILFGFANCIGQFSTGRLVTEQNIDEGMSAFLTGQTSPHDADDVRLREDRLESDGPDTVNDDNRRRVGPGDSLDQGISIVPGVEMVAVTGVVFDCNVSATALGLRYRGETSTYPSPESEVIKTMAVSADAAAEAPAEA